VIFAQDDFGDQQGEILEEEVIINKDLKIELPPAQRQFEKVPPQTTEVEGMGDIQYDYKEFDLPIADIPTRMRVLKLKQEPKPSYTGNYLKLGMGNYLTPYAEASLNSTDLSDGYYGVRLMHRSSRFGPVDQENSGESRNVLDLYGKYIGGSAFIDGSVNYTREMVHFYGYPEGDEVDRDTIKQIFNKIGLGFGIGDSNPEADFKYSIDGDLNYVSDRFDASEFGFRAGLLGSYPIEERLSASIGLDLLFLNYKNVFEISRTLVRLTPAFDFDIGPFRARAGLRVLYINDTLNYKTDTKLYPVVEAEYSLNDNLTAYAGLDGDIEENSFAQFVNENPYLKQGIQTVHTSRNLELSFGVKGSFLQILSFDAGINLGTYKNLHYFVNDSLEFNKFDVIYDGGNAGVINPFVSVTANKGTLFGGSVRLEYFKYNTKNVAEAWHRPNFVTDISAWYNFGEKLKFQADLFTYTGLKGLDVRNPNAEDQVISLDPIFDLNLKVDYIFSERYQVFLSLNNLFSQNYSYFLQYPGRGLQAMIGLSVDF
jgi:hypothetical protein